MNAGTDIMAVLLLLLVGSVSVASAQNSPLTFPPTVSSQNGGIQTSLSLEENTITIPGTGITFTSRFLNGIFTGPTYRLKPGDWLNVSFSNNLPDQGIPYRHNELSAPDETNIHFHGLHISGELPSDDTDFVVRPGVQYDYSTKLPPTHFPGTHWMHPHRHGSSALHLGGGAVSALIVEDPPGFLPAQVASAREILFLAAEMDWAEIQELADDSRDRLFSVTFRGNVRNFVAINGQYQPKITADPGEWLRFRVLWAQWRKGQMNFAIPGCEMQLLAKDGIYIRDFPRAISRAPIVPGGRADIMVRCTGASRTYNINAANYGMIASIETSGTAVASTTLASWTPEFPPYLNDLRNVAPTPGCSCMTLVGKDDGVNRRLYGDGRFHETYVGAISERDLDTDDHPYHQHIYPFQMISGFGQDGNYYLPGDWHDSTEGTGVFRFNSTEFPGKMMVHCHRLKHEDEGMMAVEYIWPSSSSASCFCASTDGRPNGVRPPTPPLPTPPPNLPPTPSPTSSPTPLPTPTPPPNPLPTQPPNNNNNNMMMVMMMMRRRRGRAMTGMGMRRRRTLVPFGNTGQ